MLNKSHVIVNDYFIKILILRIPDHSLNRYQGINIWYSLPPLPKRQWCLSKSCRNPGWPLSEISKSGFNRFLWRYNFL